MDAITLEQALELFKLPRTLGATAEGEKVVANVGRFGPYVKYGEKYVSLKEDDPYTVELPRALELIRLKQEADANRLIAAFPEAGIQVLNGRYGPYVTDGKKNAKIPKDRDPKSLTLEDCKQLIEAAPVRFGRFGRGKAKSASKPGAAAAKAQAAPSDRAAQAPRAQVAARSADDARGAEEIGAHRRGRQEKARLIPSLGVTQAANQVIRSRFAARAMRSASVCSASIQSRRLPARGDRAMFRVTAAAAVLSFLTLLSVDLPAKSAAPAGAKDIYIVVLRDLPVAANAATKPAKGQRLNKQDAAVARYADSLKARHDAVLAGVGGARKIYSYAYALNGFAAELTAAQVAKLRTDPGVISVVPNEILKLDTLTTPDIPGPRCAERRVGSGGWRAAGRRRCHRRHRRHWHLAGIGELRCRPAVKTGPPPRMDRHLPGRRAIPGEELQRQADRRPLLQRGIRR